MSHEPAAIQEPTLFPMPSPKDGPGSLCSGVLVRHPTMSKKRRAVLDYLALNQTITLAQATHLVGRNVYHNAEKHTGALLSAMVKLGFIVRQKPGLFALPNSKDQP